MGLGVAFLVFSFFLILIEVGLAWGCAVKRIVLERRAWRVGKLNWGSRGKVILDEVRGWGWVCVDG